MPEIGPELKDIYQSSSIKFKFVAFRTPSNTLTSNIQIPTRMYFTMKFYLFPEVQTDRLLLRLPKQVAHNMKT